MSCATGLAEVGAWTVYSQMEEFAREGKQRGIYMQQKTDEEKKENMFWE